MKEKAIFWGLALSWGCTVVHPAIAQTIITPDGTLPINSLVSPTFVITGGTQRGANLFHSFSQFDVGSGDIAQFNYDPSVSRIISRVTGGNPSLINGTLKTFNTTTSTVGTADLFFINPNGINFGAGSSLGVGGSFVASTANAIRFTDGTIFSASNPNPLLTVSVPLGLQFNNGAIAKPITASSSNFLNNNNTIALVGGAVNLDGVYFLAENGIIDIGSVASGEVLLAKVNSKWQFDYNNINAFQNINLSNGAFLDVSNYSASNPGKISLTGNQIIFNGSGTGIGADNWGGSSNTPSAIAINAKEALIMQNKSTVFIGAFDSGAAGTLNLKTPNLDISGGAFIDGSTFGSGSAAVLNILADNATIKGITSGGATRGGIFNDTVDSAAPPLGILFLDVKDNLVLDNAYIRTTTTGSGNANGIVINANNINLINGAAIYSDTSKAGQAGAIKISIKDRLFIDNSLIESSALKNSTGDSGSVEVKASRLDIIDGGQILSSTFATGKGGSVDVKADQISLSGFSVTSGINRPSAIQAKAEDGSAGNGGLLTIKASEFLRLLDGGQVSVSTAGNGNAGKLAVTAPAITVSGESNSGKSGLFATAVVGSGSGGDIDISSDVLTVKNNGILSVSNFFSFTRDNPGSGAAGNLIINSGLVRLENGGLISAETNAGDKGNITINATSLQMLNNSWINTNANHSSDGGNIIINADTVIGAPINGNNDITANALGGRGGRVIITTKGLFGFVLRNVSTAEARASSENNISASSELGAQFNGVVEVRSPDVDPASGLEALPSDRVNVAGLIEPGCLSAANQGGIFVATGRGGLPQSPQQTPFGHSFWQDFRPQSQTNTGTTTTTSQATDQPLLQAQGWALDRDGKVTLFADHHPVAMVQNLNCQSIFNGDHASSNEGI